MTNFRLSLTVVFVWCINVLFGAVVFNTIVLYPNFFGNVPRSLELTMEFMKASGPHDFFPPFGSGVIILNAVSLVVWWRNKQVRYLLAVSILLLITFEFLLSVLYFWKLNTILFIEGAARHPVQYLEKVAADFRFWHWIRFFTTGAAAFLALVTLVCIKRDDKGHLS